MAAAVNTMHAQNPRLGVGLSSSHTKNGIAQIRPSVSTLGIFSTSLARVRRGGREVCGRIDWTGLARAEQDNPLAGETEHACLRTRCLGRRKHPGDQTTQPPHPPLASHNKTPPCEAAHASEISPHL